MKDFKNRVAVVTGAASGIGRGMVHNFVNAGMKVVLAGRNEERLNNTVKSFKDSGADVIGVTTDVSQADQVERLAQKTLEAFGEVHVLCNNAGVGFRYRNSWDVPLDAWNWIFSVNVMGVINGIHTFIPIMLKQNSEAHIVNTSSLAGLIVNQTGIPYGVSKHAVVALSESLHTELLMKGIKIKVSVLCPGPVSTDIMYSSIRNRPNSLAPPPEPTAEEALFFKAFGIWIERGLDPNLVGRQVLDAIREERFYIITHDFNDVINQRMQNILDNKNPPVMPPPQDFLDIVEELKRG